VCGVHLGYDGDELRQRVLLHQAQRFGVRGDEVGSDADKVEVPVI